MSFTRRTHRRGWASAATFGVGAATGLTAALGLLSGRKAATISKIGKGHPLKHRALDLAAGTMQPKYPIDAMSTYLNGFHMYADDMGRQVEATHFRRPAAGVGRSGRAPWARRRRSLPVATSSRPTLGGGGARARRHDPSAVGAARTVAVLRQRLDGIGARSVVFLRAGAGLAAVVTAVGNRSSR